MRRQDASDYYFFPPEYWKRLTALGDRLVRFDAAHEGAVVASALCLRGDRWLHYHLGATADCCARPRRQQSPALRGRALGPRPGRSRSSISAAAPEAEDSLFAFKQRFSPEGRREFWVGKLVHDEDAYRRLSGGGEIDYDGFFPAYRASI